MKKKHIKMRFWVVFFIGSYLWGAVLCVAACLLNGCGAARETERIKDHVLSQVEEELNNEDSFAPRTVDERREDEEIAALLLKVPDYSGVPYAVIDGDVPGFSMTEIKLAKSAAFISTSPLDSLNRCGTAEICFKKDDMPSAPRGEIGDVKPTGWKQAKYDMTVTGTDSPYLYNRCHLLAYMFSGLNADERNLITGTRYMNTEGMLYPVEGVIADFVEENPDMHVLYRATPDFHGNDLLAHGVLMEAVSVEDNGISLSICRYAYNVEPGVTIDYSDGNSKGPEYKGR